MSTQTILPASATFTRQAHPGWTSTLVARDRMRISGESSVQSRTYLRYLVDIPDRLQLVSATHRVNAEDPLGTARALRCYRTEHVGNFNNIDWNNAPAVTGSSVSDTDDRFWEHDVTTQVGAGGTVILRFDTTASDTWWLRGWRAARQVPRLILELERRPIQPTDVQPEGNIGVAAPVVTWHGQVDVDTVQVQAAAVDEPWDIDTGFDTPTWDSGEVASGDNELDTDAAGWTGIADAASADITVREHTPAGWGDWSEPVTITRVDKPALAITSPAAPTADGSFVVTWTFTGQVAWRARVSIDDDIQDDSGKQSGATQSWQPDMGGDDAGTVYTVRVRAWDDVDRSPSLGDATFTQAILDTTFTPTDTVAPMDTLVVAQVPGLPKVTHTTTRAAGVPDRIRSIRAGKRVHVQEGVDGLTWDDWTCPPNTDVTYRARAVVNGEDADVDATDTIRTVVEAVWLVDPITERCIVLSGIEGLNVALGGNVSVHTPIAGAHLIRRTMALRGLEGSISGLIREHPTKTLAELYEDALWLRERPERQLRLIMGDLNIPVSVSNLQPIFDRELTFTDRVRHNARFDFSRARGV